MFTPSSHRLPIAYSLLIAITVALPMGVAPSTAQQAPYVVPLISTVIDASSRTSPVMFIENAGQWPEGARFQVWGGTTGTMWLAEDAIWVTVIERSPVPDSQVDGLRDRDPSTFHLQPSDLPPARAVNIKLSFVGANPHPRIEPFDRLDTVVNYFIGNDPEKWRPGVPVWGGVRYVDLYPGVDLTVTSESGGMVQRLIARPEAILDTVQLRIEGADTVAVDEDALLLSTAAGEVRLPLLKADEPDGKVSVRLVYGNRIFDLSSPVLLEYFSRPPSAFQTTQAGDSPKSTANNSAELLYGTYIGSSGRREPDIALDSIGRVFITGSTDNSTFPTTPGGFDRRHNGDDDIFVVRLNTAGTALEYASFIGGWDFDIGTSIALSEGGQVHIAGGTQSSNFPTTVGAWDRTNNGGMDAFVLRLSTSGTVLEYSTLLGGGNHDIANGMVLDDINRAYLIGDTNSSDFPATPGAFDTHYDAADAYPGHNGDTFVARLNLTNSSLDYSTFLGGTDSEYGYAIDIDRSQSVYVTGGTASPNFPISPGAFDSTCSCDRYFAIFVTKLSPAGNSLVYSTYLGGNGTNSSSAIAVGQAGDAFVAGSTGADDFPTTPGAFDPVGRTNSGDGFMVRLNSTGSALIYATYLGGTEDDRVEALALDSNDRAYLTGTTYSVNFPTSYDAYDRTHNGGLQDVFVVRLSARGDALEYGTFIGGTATGSGSGSTEDGSGIAVDRLGRAYVVGETGSLDFPTTPGAFDRTHNDWDDVFAIKLAMGVKTYTISGFVTDSNSTGLGGVTVWAGFLRATTTDAYGYYTFTELPAGTYTIRPEKAPYAFSPASRTVTVPPNATGVDFQTVAITKIQVNQVLGNTTNYVAGKDTAVRVFMSDAVPFDPDHQQLQIYRNGNLITQTPLKPRKFSGRSEVLDFLCDRAECDGWKKGFYSFEARVNGDYLSQPSVEFKGRRKLKLLAIPVKAMVDGKPEMPDSVWLNYVDDLILKTFPISSDGLSVIPESKRPIDATDLDLSSPLGRIRLAARVATYQPFMCGLPFRPACYDLVTAIIPRDSTGSTRIEGWAGIPGANSVIVMAGEGLDMRVAHEAGHVIGAIAFRPGLGDEYDKSGWNCGTFRCTANPPPRGYSGYDGDWVVRGFLCPVIPFHCSDPDVQEWRPGSGFGSAVLADRDGPFDVTGSGALDDKLSFMGLAGAGADSYWISPDAYDFLFTNLAPTSVTSAAAPQTSERVATVSGWITDQAYATFLPIYHFLTSPPPSGTGAYTVEVRSAQGSILASQSFDLSFVMLSNPPELLSEAFFRVEVLLPTGSRSIRLVNEGRALAEKQISAHAPSLAVTSPTAGQTWAATGNYTIRWQGSDLDGDTLYYTVLYRQGTGDWMVLGADLTANELTVNAADLPGGTAAQVQVLATDGINTTAVESGLFTVGRKGPEAFITHPAEGASFMPGVSLFFQGSAYDLEDGTLPDSAYRWTSNKDGDLGTGASNLLILSRGPHVIKLTVTDSDGNTAVKTIRLSAGDRLFLPMVLRGQ